MKSDTETLRDLRTRLGELLTYAQSGMRGADAWDKFVEARGRLKALEEVAELIAQPQVTNG